MKFLSVPAFTKLTSSLNALDLGDRIIRGRVEAYSCKQTNHDKKLSKFVERQLSSEINAELSAAPPPSSHATTSLTIPQNILTSIQTPAATNTTNILTNSHSQHSSSLSPASSSSSIPPHLSVSVPPTASSSSSSSSSMLSRSSNLVPLSRGSPNLMSNPPSTPMPAGPPSFASSSSIISDSPLGPLNDSNTRKLLVALITTMNTAFQDYDFSNLRPEQFDKEPDFQVAMTTINNLFVESINLQQPGFRSEFWKAIDDNIELDKCEVYSFNPESDSDIVAGKLWAANFFFYNKKKKMIVFVSAYAVSKLHGSTSGDSDEVSDSYHSTSSSADDDEFDDDDEDSSNHIIDENLLSWDNATHHLASSQSSSSSSADQDEELLPLPTTSTLSPFIAGVKIGSASHSRSNSASSSSSSASSSSHLGNSADLSTPFALDRHH